MINMTILKKIWKNSSGLYEAVVELGDREIHMIQRLTPKLRIPHYDPEYDSPKQKENIRKEGEE